jgi:hypothetical protein
MGGGPGAPPQRRSGDDLGAVPTAAHSHLPALKKLAGVLLSPFNGINMGLYACHPRSDPGRTRWERPGLCRALPIISLTLSS